MRINIISSVYFEMPPKGATQARKEQLDKARPHFLTCLECKLKVKCPKDATNNDPIEAELLDPDIKHEEMNMTTVKIFIQKGSIREKSEILAFLLNSEANAIWDDQKNATCNISQSTVRSITQVSATDWYEGRHQLIKTIAEELSKGAARRGHDQERALEREQKELTKSLKCRLIGACYKTINHQFTSPVEVKSAILFRSIAQSKIGSMVLSRQGACGSKDAFEQIVIRNCSPEIQDSPGDVLETIDNNERGSRTYSAKLNSTMKMSLVTARNIYK